MTNTTETTNIRTATSATGVAAIASTLASAFHDDPVFAWCLPDARRRAEVLPALFELVAEGVRPYGETFVNGDVAAALWVPPGCPVVPAEQSTQFEEQLASVLGADGERLFALMEELDAHHPEESHRFLWFLGVQGGRQGSGHGSALLTSMLARCDAEGVPAALDATSDRNRRLYERHGFEVVAPRSVDGSPVLWSMRRVPQRLDHRDGTHARPLDEASE